MFGLLHHMFVSALSTSYLCSTVQCNPHSSVSNPHCCCLAPTSYSRWGDHNDGYPAKDKAGFKFLRFGKGYQLSHRFPVGKTPSFTGCTGDWVLDNNLVLPSIHICEPWLSSTLLYRYVGATMESSSPMIGVERPCSWQGPYSNNSNTEHACHCDVHICFAKCWCQLSPFSHHTFMHSFIKTHGMSSRLWLYVYGTSELHPRLLWNR